MQLWPVSVLWLCLDHMLGERVCVYDSHVTFELYSVSHQRDRVDGSRNPSVFEHMLPKNLSLSLVSSSQSPHHSVLSSFDYIHVVWFGELTSRQSKNSFLEKLDECMCARMHTHTLSVAYWEEYLWRWRLRVARKTLQGCSFQTMLHGTGTLCVCVCAFWVTIQIQNLLLCLWKESSPSIFCVCMSVWNMKQFLNCYTAELRLLWADSVTFSTSMFKN